MTTRIPRIYGCVKTDGDSLAHGLSPFNNALGSPVTGGRPSESATKAHTNLHRCTLAGLPRGQELDLRAPGGSLRARLSEPLAQPVADLAAATAACFTVMQKTVWEGTLFDLALEAVRVESALLTAEFGFDLELQCQSASAREGLRRHLCRTRPVDVEDIANEARFVCDAVGEAAKRTAYRWWQTAGQACRHAAFELSRASLSGQRLNEAIARLRGEPRQLTIWCSLDARPASAKAAP